MANLWAEVAIHHPQQFLDHIRGSKNEGEQIVHQFCSTCHALKPMIEIGAPKMGVENDWKPRLKAGLESLLQHTEEGLNAMPPRGGCFECTSHQLRLAILAMLPKFTDKDYK